jgi:hypothetical protein
MMDSRSLNSDWLVGAVKRNPEGLLLMAAGCALMMRSGGLFGKGTGSGQSSNERNRTYRGGTYGSDGHYGSSDGNDPLSSARNKIDAASESVRDFAGDVRDKVGSTASAYASSASEYFDKTRETVTRQATQATRQARTTLQETTERVISEQPLAVALAGLAAGAAIASIFPTTRMETDALGPTREKISEFAEQASTQLRQATAKAGESLKSAAEQRGLSGEGFKEVVREAAGAFGDTLSNKQPGGAQSSPSQSAGTQPAAPQGGQNSSMPNQSSQTPSMPNQSGQRSSAPYQGGQSAMPHQSGSSASMPNQSGMPNQNGQKPYTPGGQR